MMAKKKVVCCVPGSSGDWGGASRVFFTNIKLINRKKYKLLVLLPEDGPIVPDLEKQGIAYRIWRMHGFNGFIQYVSDIWRCVCLFRKHKVDILDFNGTGGWRPAEIIAAKILRIPIVMHYHVVIERPGPFVRFASLVIANSEFTAKKSHTDNAPIDVVYCSVDLDRFDSAKNIKHEFGLSHDDIVISFIGQIREIKGVDLFIRLAKCIKDDHVKFLIVGECRDAEKYEGSYTRERLNQEIGDSSHIIYAGYRSDVQNLYCMSDIIVMPSRWDEPFGLINIEAGAARKPIVATNVGGIPEIVKNGENGFLVERGDFDGLLVKVKKLIESEQLRKDLGSNGRLIVEKRFTTAPIRKLEKLYDRL